MTDPDNTGNGGPAVGLALGGGAARGLAHIPVLEALDDLGIRPARVAGCSIGALLGGAYAAGLSAAAIRAHALEVLSGPRAAANRLFAGLRGSPRAFNFSLFRSPPLNGLGLVDLVAPPEMDGRIEDCPIPFAVNATDYATGAEVVLEHGELRPAVAASIAIPGVISAPRLDGRLLIDGAYVAPVPMHLVRDCDIVLGVDVTGLPQAGARDPGPAALAVGATQILQRRITALMAEQARPEIMITPDIDRFALYDFLRIEEILEAAAPERERVKARLGAALERLG